MADNERAYVKNDWPTLPLFHTGYANFLIYDRLSGLMLCAHPVRQVTGPNANAYYLAEREVAQRIANALNANPHALDEIVAEMCTVQETFVVQQEKA